MVTCAHRKKPSSSSPPIHETHELDIFLSKLCTNGNSSIDITPGTCDPTNANFPHRSSHYCLLQIVANQHRQCDDVIDDMCF